MPYRRCLAILAILAAAVCTTVAMPAAAQGDGGAFVARGVEVDVTASNASEARDQALAEGQMKAFRQLLMKLTAVEDHSRLPQPDPSTVANMVQGFDVEEEKSSGVRYIATLSYRFDPEAVRALLQNYSVAYAESRSAPLVVVPVLREGGTATLWEDPNPWRQTWSDMVGQSGLVPIVVPIGDLKDIASVKPDQALAGDQAALDALAARYDASETLVAVASRDGESVTVEATRYGPGGATPMASLSTQGEGALDEAANAVVERIEIAWKNENLVRTDVQASLDVLVPIRTLSEWVAVRRRLENVGQVRDATLSRLQKGEAQVTLTYYGGVGQLQAALGRNGLDLRQGVVAWVLALRGGAPVPSQAPGQNEPLMAPTGGGGPATTE